MRLSLAGRGVCAAVAGVVLAGGCVLAVPGAARAAETARSARSHDFGSFPAAKYLSCTGSAKITGSFSLDVSGVTGTFKKWKPGDHDHTFTASLGLTTRISASVDVGADTTCTPGKALEKLATVKFTVDGIVVKLRPDFYLTISAKGSITASRSITQSVTLSGELGGSLNKPSYSISRGNPVISASGSAAFTAVIGGEAEILAGVLDLDFALMGGVAATAHDSQGEVCVTGYPALRATVTVGVQFFDWNPKKSLLDATWEIKSIAGHSTKFSFCSDTPPEIVTTTLPVATVGQRYSAELTTADHRKGTWKIISGKLPPGLALSGYTVSGTPKTAGTDSVKLEFTDTHGKTATATVTIRVGTGGMTWTPVEAKVPAGWPALANTTPVAVSCPTAGFCAAVGTDAGPYNAIWFRKNGAWTAGAQVPSPPDATAPPGGSAVYVAPIALSCPSASLCVLAGDYYSGDDLLPLLMTWSNGTWTQDSLAGSYNYGGQAGLSGVSCPTTSYCVAVGTNSYYYVDPEEDGFQVTLGIVATWHGSGTWTVADAPAPGNALQVQGNPAESQLTAVSCASASSCTAVGTYPDTSDDTDGLAEAFSNGAWAPRELPVSAASGGLPELTAVSCPSVSFCAVAGQYLNASDAARGLLMTESGGSWKVATAPFPPGAPGGSSYKEQAISCATAQSCVIAGIYNDASGQYSDLLTLSGGVWAGGNVPAPPDSATGEGGVQGVSCPSASFCVAVGGYEDASTEGDDGLLLTGTR